MFEKQKTSKKETMSFSLLAPEVRKTIHLLSLCHRSMQAHMPKPIGGGAFK